MIINIRLRLEPRIFNREEEVKRQISIKSGIPESHINAWQLLRKSIDARQRIVYFETDLLVYTDDDKPGDPKPADNPFASRNVKESEPVAVIGAGPAGLFSALQLIEKGFKPIIFERGKSVRERRRDLVAITRSGIVNEDSNYCFGEGGAGTFSDGKLYTRSNKRGDVQKILKTFVFFGADAGILTDTHPHIGTNKLPGIIENIRNFILSCGGEIYFNHRLITINRSNNSVKSLVFTNTLNESQAEYGFKKVILATGHSARNIYEHLYHSGVQLEVKPFALGVRIEHPQALIDEIQYHCFGDELTDLRQHLPASSYSLVEDVDGRGVYSFCMCPGGIIAPCATANNEVVTNGWSPSKRNNYFANSGMVVALNENDFYLFKKHRALMGLYFQKEIEHSCYLAGGGKQVAPAQRLTDFLQDKSGNSLPACSYTPGIKSVNIKELFPPVVFSSLKMGLQQIIRKKPKFLTEDAVLVATESRTSTPVRIPRNAETLEHIEMKGLFPCGEGAGYAGGIVSAAIDGVKVALKAAG